MSLISTLGPIRRPAPVVLLLAALLASCDGEPRARNPDARVAATASGALFADGADLPGDIQGTVRVSSRIAATSSDGREADLVLGWMPMPAVRAAIVGGTRLVVRLHRGDAAPVVLSRQRVDADAPGGEIEVTVPADETDTRLTLGLEGLADGVIDDLPTYTTLALPTLLRAPVTDLTTLSWLGATLVPDSYRSTIEDGRRLHRFAVKVEGVTSGDDRSSGRTSVTGLEAAASRHFTMRENGEDDIESPVRAAWRSEPVSVYLVMDVSSSITLADAADDLLDAVSRTLLALAPVARFDYRVFASDVYEIDGLRELAFDDVEESGTALFRALDTALDDIETREEGDAIVIAFTDGRDFASRNFYPAFRSHEQVRDHLLNRLRNVGQSRRALGGHRFETHVVSLGSDIDVEALEALALAGGGRWFPSYDNATIEAAFDDLTAGVRGIYQLEYSSQQLADDNSLELSVQAGDQVAEPVILPTRNGLAPSD